MLTLIAESKTMTPYDAPVGAGSLWPIGEQTADEIMAHIAGMTVPEAVAALKLSSATAAKAIKLAYEFPNKETGQKAVEAFTGVVYKALDYLTLSEREKAYLVENLRILSSLYGYLTPEGFIKAYRLDYTTPIAPGDKPLATYWKKDTTINLVRELKERPGDAILNLLPGDAAKMVDWKLVKHFAPVWKVDFKELRDSSALERLAGADPDLTRLPAEAFKTPNATRLKEHRGHLLREMAQRGITAPEALLTLETDRLLPLGTPDYPDHIAFLI